MVVMWQKVVSDPAPVCEPLVANGARRTESRARGHRRTDLHERFVSGVATGFQFPAMPGGAKGQTPARAARPPDGQARASQGGLPLE